MNPQIIEDSDDPRIATYRNVRDQDIVGRLGSFVAEGSVVLRKLLQSASYAPQSALILENRLAGVEDIVETMTGRGLPVYVAARPVIDAIAGFAMHRGVLAIGAPRALPTPEAVLSALPDKATVIVCIGISNHDNIGAIFRNAAGLGAGAVLFDRTCCDPLYRKAIRVSVGSVFEMPHARFEDAEALIALLDRAGYRQLALTPAGAVELTDVAPASRFALYLGAEGPGLPDNLINRLEAVRIDMHGGFDSLNVATAGAIALHSLRSRTA